MQAQYEERAFRGGQVVSIHICNVDSTDVSAALVREERCIQSAYGVCIYILERTVSSGNEKDDLAYLWFPCQRSPAQECGPTLNQRPIHNLVDLTITIDLVRHVAAQNQQIKMKVLLVAMFLLWRGKTKCVNSIGLYTLNNYSTTSLRRPLLPILPPNRRVLPPLHPESNRALRLRRDLHPNQQPRILLMGRPRVRPPNGRRKNVRYVRRW